MKSFIKNKKLKKSSRDWLVRQINDPYVAKAKQFGYRSRAVFKIEEIDQKFKIFKKNDIVIDLGAAPGGWSQYISKKTKRVIALDLLDIAPIVGVDIIKGDFTQSHDIISEILQDELASVIVSDMAPNTCGIRQVDNIRIMNLVESVYEFCEKKLKQNGCMITKVFQGGVNVEFLNVLKKNFSKIHHFKPKSSRAESQEIYLICVDFKKN